jgi:BMFP domain-containing protein YqiC
VNDAASKGPEQSGPFLLQRLYWAGFGAIPAPMREKIIDDLAGMMGGAAGLLADIREQVRGDMRDRMKNVADRIDLASREELQALEARIAALEAALKPKKPAARVKAKAAAPKKKSRR